MKTSNEKESAVITLPEIDREMNGEDRSMVRAIWLGTHGSSDQGYHLSGNRWPHSSAGLLGPSRGDAGLGNVETIAIDRQAAERRITPLEMLVATTITVAAICLSLVVTKENATLSIALGFFGLLSGGLSTSGMRKPGRQNRQGLLFKVHHDVEDRHGEPLCIHSVDLPRFSLNCTDQHSPLTIPR
jgi:hypothetical protein